MGMTALYPQIALVKWPFPSINPADPRVWEVFLLSGVFFHFFLQCLQVFIEQDLSFLDHIYPEIVYVYGEWDGFLAFFLGMLVTGT